MQCNVSSKLFIFVSNYSNKQKRKKSLKEGRTPDHSDYKEFKLNAENIGFKLLQKLGWQQGQGLGKANQGIQEPVNKYTNLTRFSFFSLSVYCWVRLGQGRAGTFEKKQKKQKQKKQKQKQKQKKQKPYLIRIKLSTSGAPRRFTNWVLAVDHQEEEEKEYSPTRTTQTLTCIANV